MKKELMLFVMMLLPMVANAYDAQIDGIYYNLNVQEKTAVVTSGDNKYTGSVLIPSSITKDNVEYTVNGIENSTFSGCTSLISVSLPSSLTYIGDYAFEGCRSLSFLDIPEKVDSIGDGAFSLCTHLKSVSIPSSVTYIGSSAFYVGDSGQLSAVYINNLESWCRVVFQGLYSNPLNHGATLYINDEEIKELSIPYGIDKLNNNTFAGCNCICVTIPSSVTCIGENCFRGCSMLSEITIPTSVTSIGDYCFNGCKMLPKISIPSSVTSIGEGCFIYCSMLAEICVTDGNPVYDSRENCNAIINTSANQLEYGCSGTTIPLDVTSIKRRAFEGSNIKTITIPNNIKTIECGSWGGDNPFASCKIENLIIDMDTIAPVFREMESIKELVLGGHVRSGIQAFRGCKSLTTLTFSEGISEIPEGMFLDCTSLDNVIIPRSVETIGSSAFQGCPQLKNLTIPEGVEVINNQAFMDCVQLESLSLPSTIKEVGSLAFFNTLWYKNQPDGIIYFGSIVYAFKGNHSVENEIDLEIREGSTKIMNSAFSGCKGLKSIILPNSINSIGSSAFQDCISLRRIELPDSLSIISWGLFDGCMALEEIVIPNRVVKIEEWAFNNCRSLQSISIPNGVSSLGGRVFYGCI